MNDHPLPPYGTAWPQDEQDYAEARIREQERYEARHLERKETSMRTFGEWYGIDYRGSPSSNPGIALRDAAEAGWNAGRAELVGALERIRDRAQRILDGEVVTGVFGAADYDIQVVDGVLGAAEPAAEAAEEGDD